jgi:hypothetical protein
MNLHVCVVGCLIRTNCVYQKQAPIPLVNNDNIRNYKINSILFLKIMQSVARIITSANERLIQHRFSVHQGNQRF